MAKRKKGGGRPPKKAADRRSEMLLLKLTPAENATLGRVRRLGLQIAPWARQILLAEAERLLAEKKKGKCPGG